MEGRSGWSTIDAYAMMAMVTMATRLAPAEDTARYGTMTTAMAEGSASTERLAPVYDTFGCQGTGDTAAGSDMMFGYAVAGPSSLVITAG